MILTKSEFKERFSFKYLSQVSNLLKAKSIIANEDGLIDLDNKKNKAWIKKREKQLKAEESKKQKEEKQTVNNDKNVQLDLNLEILNQRLDEKLKKNRLLDLKISKENKEIVEVDVLNRIITTVFDSLFKTLSDIPLTTAEDIINIVNIEEYPKEKLISFLTDKILTTLKSAVDTAEAKTKKFYE